jgi:ATP-dependent DNA ligase
MLRLYQPCLPTRVYVAPHGSRWQFEPKLDGFRIIARKTRTRVVLQTKEGYDYTDRYPLIVDALKRMRARSIVFDGEAMCGNSFDDLWNRAADEHVRLCAFDLLELNGEDLREQALLERKRRLAQLLRKERDGLEYVPHLQGDGDLIFEHVCKLGLEGIVCKRIDMPYRAGRSKHWLKLKNRAHPATMRVRQAFEEERRHRHQPLRREEPGLHRTRNRALPR